MQRTDLLSVLLLYNHFYREPVASPCYSTLCFGFGCPIPSFIEWFQTVSRRTEGRKGEAEGQSTHIIYFTKVESVKKGNDMTIQSILIYCVIGTVAGILSGLFGVGGGLIIIPALIYFAGYSQLQATGTSLAVLLPPIGIMATAEYYRRGCVNMKAALIIAGTLMLAAWGGARVTRKFNELYVRLGFGGLLLIVGIIIVITSIRKLRG